LPDKAAFVDWMRARATIYPSDKPAHVSPFRPWGDSAFTGVFKQAMEDAYHSILTKHFTVTCPAPGCGRAATFGGLGDSSTQPLLRAPRAGKIVQFP
jgi:hypothetical protein